MRRIAALYVDPRGPYPEMAGVDCWDEARDARKYAGPYPVVAHPPCGPWGRLRHLYLGLEHDCAPQALAAVWRFGGVLEHPAGSGLWDACCLPKPGELPDRFGGYTIEVDQCDWGHVARKRTWLYLVGVPRPTEFPPKGTPTHHISRDSKRAHRNHYTLKRASPQMCRRTPPAFAEWLVALARTAKAPSVATYSDLLPSPTPEPHP